MKRSLIALAAISVMLISFQFRTLNFSGIAVGFTGKEALPWMLIVNKVIRYFINDLAALALLWAIFERRDFMQFAIWVLLFGLVALLPVYFIGYFYFANSLGITLSYLHRLVMNPTLMMLLIPLFYFQQKIEKTPVS
jgi:exosortase F-associated protein